LERFPIAVNEIPVLASENVALTGTYEYGEVARSVLIAIAASYAALDLAGRVTASRGRARLAWLSGGAVAMGIGIWAMHLKGMLAFHLPVPVEYHWPTALAALSVAILASAVALYVASRQKTGPVEALIGSIVMGAGIAGMHYIGMAAMRLPAVTRYSPLLVACSILLAILFSLIALLMAFGSREDTQWSFSRRLGSAIVLGVAISAMHYTGMAAASFFPAPRPDFSHAISVSPIGSSGVVIATLIVLVAAVITSSVDRRARAEIQRLNQELERRVAERTSQLEAVNQSLRKEIAERQRAEEAVLRSEEHLRLVIDIIPQQIMSGPNDGTLDFANAQWRSYTGLTLEELKARGWQRIIHPDDRESLLKVVEESRAQGKPYEQEVRRRGADGQYRWFLARGVPLKDSEGRIVRWYGTSTDIQDRKEAENRTRLVIDTAPAMLHSARPDGYVDFFNKRWLEYVGLSLEDISGWRWTNVMHPEDAELAVGKWRSSVATGRPLETEARLRRADGEYRLMLLRKVPLRDETGSIVKWYGSATDIEDRKRAEQELRQAEEHIRAILEYSPNWIFLKDTEGRYLLVNREIERVFCIGQAQIKGKTDSEMFPPEQAAEYRANDLKVLRAGLTMEFEETALLEDGPHTSIVHKFPLFDTHGKIYATGGVATDITERKRAEEARRQAEAELRESEGRFRLVADSAPVMIWMSGTDKLCTYFNKPWLDFTGRSLDRELGNGWAEEVHPEDLRSCMVTYVQAFDRREAFRMVYRLRRHDGEFRWVLDIGVPRFNQDRSFAGYIGSCIDVTEQRRAEEQLRQAQADLARITRMAAMGELAAAIAHEVNQPLGAVVTNGNAALRWLAGQPRNLEEAREAIERTVREANRASDVIGRIRALLQKAPPQMERLDMNSVIREVLTLAGNELLRGGIAVQTELAPGIPNVLGDRVQLQQVLLNLILNAIEAMSTITDQPRELLITSAKHADGVLIQVHDSGVGVDPEQADRILEPFFTTKHRGIGMGLSISRSIVEAHGGRLWFTPGSSHGVVFQFTVPKAD
jgi:PAS domain S-box-containing protein